MRIAHQIQAKNLTCVRGDQLVFSNVSFTLGPGKLLWLKGANGAGKSSLLRMIAGLINPYEGELIQPFDNPLFIDHCSLLRPALTVRENLRSYGEVTSSTIKSWNLSDILEMKVRQLSKGQMARIKLCLLDISSTKLWLLDEPLINLDETGKKTLARKINLHVQDEGLCIIASHEMDENFEEFMFLDLGKIQWAA